MLKEMSFKKKWIFIIGIIITILIIAILFSLKVFNKKVTIEELKKSVVLINVYDKNNELIATGSGVVAFSDDVVLTNAHVVEDNYKLEVLSEDNTKYSVEGIIAYNKGKDIAILKLKNSKSLKNVKATTKISVGDDVTAIGSPLGLKNTVSNGNLSGYFQDEIEVYQHTAPISHGSSGGGLFNKNGKLVGITYASIEGGQNLNLAIPIKYYEQIYNQTKNNVPIETSKYTYLTNSILKTRHGSQLLSFALNDKYGNEKFKSGSVEENDANEIGNLEICKSLKNCSFVFENHYMKIDKYVDASLYLSSGQRKTYGLDDNGNVKLISDSAGYVIIMLKKSDESNDNELENFLKKEFGEMELVKTKKYIYSYSCDNYDKCDEVKKILENITG